MSDDHSHNHPVCGVCGRTPPEIDEYCEAAETLGMSADTYVRSEEGTYNADEDAFFCTACYVKIGMPRNTDRQAHRPPTTPSDA